MQWLRPGGRPIPLAGFLFAFNRLEPAGFFSAVELPIYAAIQLRLSAYRFCCKSAFGKFITVGPENGRKHIVIWPTPPAIFTQFHNFTVG